MTKTTRLSRRAMLKGTAASAGLAVGSGLIDGFPAVHTQEPITSFDRRPSGERSSWLDRSAIGRMAAALIAAYRIKTASKDAPVATLSGGNVQRTVLARELSAQVNLLIVANPCFGLDFAAVAEIRGQIMQARNRGAAVLMVSEDLDELLELSDRLLVMSEGRIVYETPTAGADRQVVGQHMAGHH